MSPSEVRDHQPNGAEPPPVYRVHEDDWGMVELVPKENLGQFAVAFGEAAVAAAQHKESEHGYSDVFIAPTAKTALESRGIVEAELLSEFAEALPEARTLGEWRYSGEQPSPLDRTKFYAYGRDDTWALLYGSLDNQVVTGCWLSEQAFHLTDNDESLRLLVAALETIGRRHDLIIVDWYQEVIVDPTDFEALHRYLLNQDRE